MKNFLNWIKIGLGRRAAILMYHRINAADPDVWGSLVRPDHFAEQLEVLRKIATPLSLRDFLEARRAAKVPSNAVVVTLDDGYLDNLSNAKPLLERFDVPATVFITSGCIGGEREFWWDELEQLLLRPRRLPAALQLNIDGRTRRWELGDSATYLDTDQQRDLNKKAWDGKAGSRLHLYYSVWQALRSCEHETRVQQMDAIARWAGVVPAVRASRRVLKVSELRTLASSPLIEIGAHTVSHAFLPAHSRAVQSREIRASKENLESLLDRPLTSFAYPHGSYDSNAVALVEQAGFVCACTTTERPVSRSSAVLELPRFQVEDWSGDEFQRRFQSWMCR